MTSSTLISLSFDQSLSVNSILFFPFFICTLSSSESLLLPSAHLSSDELISNFLAFFFFDTLLNFFRLFNESLESDESGSTPVFFTLHFLSSLQLPSPFCSFLSSFPLLSLIYEFLCSVNDALISCCSCCLSWSILRRLGTSFVLVNIII